MELEARAGLGRVSSALAPLSLFSNLTLMQSKVQLGGDGGAAEAERAMVGQAPIVLNAGVTWSASRSPFSATVLLNHVGEKIVTASQRPLPVTREAARTAIDASLRFPITRGFAGKLDAKNLLDQPYVQTQGAVIRESYRAGRVYTLGLSWQ